MLKETANEDPKTHIEYFENLDFELEYKHPTPGEFPVIGYLTAHKEQFKLNCPPEDITVEKTFTPTPPPETDNPADLDDRQNVLNIAASGCNLTMKVADPAERFNLQPFLKFCKNKLGVIAHSGIPSFHDDDHPSLESYYGSFISNPEANQDDSYKKVVAFLLKDEPSLKELTAMDDLPSGEGKEPHRPVCYCNHRMAVKIRDTEGLDGMILINLLPIHGLGTAKEYQEYLDTFQTRCNPTMYSVDVYPVLQSNPVALRGASLNGIKNRNSGEIVQVHERFYRTLEMVAAQAKKNNRPFWYYPLCGEHTDAKTCYYPAQKEEYLRYSVFTGLAYGAKAICLWRVLENTDDSKNLTLDINDKAYSASFLRHPINVDRTRSPFWYYVRRINLEIKRYKDVFLNTEVKGVYHTGLEELAQYAGARNAKGWPENLPYTVYGFVPGVETLPVPKQATAEVWGLRPLKVNSLPVIKSVVSLEKGLGVLVSHLVEKTAPAGQAPSGTGASRITISTREPNQYYMIVNHDAANAQRVRVKFNPGYKVRVLTPYHSGMETPGTVIDTTLDMKDMNFDYTLNPGGYLIFQLEVKKPT